MSRRTPEQVKSDKELRDSQTAGASVAEVKELIEREDASGYPYNGLTKEQLVWLGITFSEEDQRLAALENFCGSDPASCAFRNICGQRCNPF